MGIVLIIKFFLITYGSVSCFLYVRLKSVTHLCVILNIKYIKIVNKEIHTWGEKKLFGAVAGQNGHCEKIEQLVHKESCCPPPEKVRRLFPRPYKVISMSLSVHLFPPNNLYIYI